jgi:hypothetical protein
MACNAMNHPPDCDCGWGGVFYESNRTLIDPDWSNESSHTTPNAKCPICSSQVFFYRSPDGGAVFFDDLGPPWPKHPCTNQDASDEERKLANKLNKDGWWPFLRTQTVPLPSREGVSIWDREERGLFIKGNSQTITKDVPIWIKPILGKAFHYRVSTLKTKNGKTYEINCNAFGIQALQNPDISQIFPESIKHMLIKHPYR